MCKKIIITTMALSVIFSPHGFANTCYINAETPYEPNTSLESDISEDLLRNSGELSLSVEQMTAKAATAMEMAGVAIGVGLSAWQVAEAAKSGDISGEVFSSVYLAESIAIPLLEAAFATGPIGMGVGMATMAAQNITNTAIAQHKIHDIKKSLKKLSNALKENSDQFENTYQALLSDDWTDLYYYDLNNFDKIIEVTFDKPFNDVFSQAIQGASKGTLESLVDSGNYDLSTLQLSMIPAAVDIQSSTQFLSAVDKLANDLKELASLDTETGLMALFDLRFGDLSQLSYEQRKQTATFIIDNLPSVADSLITKEKLTQGLLTSYSNQFSDPESRQDMLNAYTLGMKQELGWKRVTQKLAAKPEIILPKDAMVKESFAWVMAMTNVLGGSFSSQLVDDVYTEYGDVAAVLSMVDYIQEQVGDITDLDKLDSVLNEALETYPHPHLNNEQVKSELKKLVTVESSYVIDKVEKAIEKGVKPLTISEDDQIKLSEMYNVEATEINIDWLVSNLEARVNINALQANLSEKYHDEIKDLTWLGFSVSPNNEIEDRLEINNNLSKVLSLSFSEQLNELSDILSTYDLDANTALEIRNNIGQLIMDHDEENQDVSVSMGKDEDEAFKSYPIKNIAGYKLLIDSILNWLGDINDDALQGRVIINPNNGFTLYNSELEVADTLSLCVGLDKVQSIAHAKPVLHLEAPVWSDLLMPSYEGYTYHYFIGESKNQHAFGAPVSALNNQYPVSKWKSTISERTDQRTSYKFDVITANNGFMAKLSESDEELIVRNMSGDAEWRLVTAKLEEQYTLNIDVGLGVGFNGYDFMDLLPVVSLHLNQLDIDWLKFARFSNNPSRSIDDSANLTFVAYLEAKADYISVINSGQKQFKETHYLKGAINSPEDTAQDLLLSPSKALDLDYQGTVEFVESLMLKVTGIDILYHDEVMYQMFPIEPLTYEVGDNTAEKRADFSLHYHDTIDFNPVNLGSNLQCGQ